MGDGRTSQELGRMKTLPHIRAASRAVEPNEEPIKRPPAVNIVGSGFLSC